LTRFNSNTEIGYWMWDVGCGPGGSFPYLVEAVGPHSEVIGVEISPELTINAKRRIEAMSWNNVQVIEGNARTTRLNGKFDGLVIFAAPDVYASPEALATLLPYLKDDARIVVFEGKLSRRRSAGALNVLFQSLMKLSFSSTPRLNYEPWCVLENSLTKIHVQEYFFGCMFLVSGCKKSTGS
jgi:protein-L-isoaspartate O-methyltransferase